LYKKFGNLGVALKYAFPDVEWDLNKFSILGKKSEQRWLKRIMESLLPGVEILEDFQHPELAWGVHWILFNLLFSIYSFIICLFL
jgi:hypothetical protein